MSYFNVIIAELLWCKSNRTLQDVTWKYSKLLPESHYPDIDYFLAHSDMLSSLDDWCIIITVSFLSSWCLRKTRWLVLLPLACSTGIWIFLNHLWNAKKILCKTQQHTASLLEKVAPLWKARTIQSTLERMTVYCDKKSSLCKVVTLVIML